MPPSTHFGAPPLDDICENGTLSATSMAANQRESKCRTKGRPTMASVSRHNSEPNLATKTTLAEFMRWWNRREVALSVRCRRAVPPILPLCHRMLFRRSNRAAQQQQQQQQQFLQRAQQQQFIKSAVPLQQMPTTTTTAAPIHLQQASTSSAPPSPAARSSSPPSNSSSRHVLSRAGWRDKMCPDGDLLPASWFMLSSEDLFRLHLKLQRRINQRRSVTRANFAFGEGDRRRANILQKYHRFPAAGLRRAMSDHQICFMDPRRDVEAEEIRRGGPKGNSLSSKLSSSSASKKRVSFSTAAIIVPPPPSPAARDEDDGNESAGGEEKVPSMGQQPAHECYVRPPPAALSPATFVVSLPAALATPVKPILARKSDRPSLAFSAVAVVADPPSSSAEFRRRINTVTSVGDDALCAMDYATFRAWRRGSRLSVDVLNNANSCGVGGGGTEVQNAVGVAQSLGKSAGGARPNVVGWLRLLKRVLDDCLRQKKEKRPNAAGAEVPAGGKRRVE
uniref:Uncharacterized protein n=1 Tax=Globodera rostochiensis TaxID=31243 RepID=A0A914H321_GLORO